ncbi:helix-turn-helix domain-containing protein [Paenibacillus sp. FSL H8-0457]|uniref:helix-turn-helix domain-containing protein n=1 Tax=Paenibacillus sp. FSL H8-0457 TaxID=2921386 RepID=UPI0001789C23|nr:MULTISPECIES: helix-turn-helix domain-containing protein [unclassified Paenibacillus]ETT67346.1 transposase [Paenibacillus sp. FSL H8-457]
MSSLIHGNEENMSYREVARRLGIRNKTQVEVWVKWHQEGRAIEQEAFHKGRPKTKLPRFEEEIAYLKAETAYLKKLYPNLHGE